MNPYVIRIVSLAKRAGKTSIGCSLATWLLKAGARVAVVKHTVEPIEYEKDTGRYFRAGAELVIALSSIARVFYESRPSPSLKETISSIPSMYRIVLVEGFKSENEFDCIGVVDNEDEALDLKGSIKRVVAFATLNRELEGKIIDGVRVYGLNTIGSLGELVLNKAVEYYVSRLPGLNCGLCGYGSCREYAQAILSGLDAYCPILSDVRLIVNDKELTLTPFVKKALSSMIIGFITSLKGAPKEAGGVESFRVEFKRSI